SGHPRTTAAGSARSRTVQRVRIALIDGEQQPRAMAARAAAHAEVVCGSKANNAAARARADAIATTLTMGRDRLPQTRIRSAQCS
ncbi:hypothetical protein Dimus_005099, partial [Dionaea muscipula]